jgi:hypothetical protein
MYIKECEMDKVCSMHGEINIVRVNISWKIRWVGHLTSMMEVRNAYRSLVGKPQRKRLLG